MKLFFLIFLFLPILASAQSVVINSAGAGEELPSAACLSCAGADWDNPEKITMPDGSVTLTGLSVNGNCFMSTCFYSRFLYAHDFNFSIPLAATIDSIFVDILRISITPNSVRDSVVQLQQRDSLSGVNLKSSAIWPATPMHESYGHNNPLWGSTWLPADLNDPASGVVLKIQNVKTSQALAGVDHIQMTVHFTTTTGMHSETSSPAAVEWINSPDEISMNIFTPTPVNCMSKIYSISGQEIKSINYGQSLAGQNYFQCSTRSLAGGIYFWNIFIGDKTYSRKFFVAK